MLTAECDERDARRRIRLVHEAKFPRTKRLADFDHTRILDLTPAALGHLAGGSWIDKGEPLVLLGDSGSGKTHLLIALGTIAAEAGSGSATSPAPSWSTSSPKPPMTNSSPASSAATPGSTCSASTRSAA